jgi:hypothetical protein
VNSVTTPKVEAFYWTAITFSQTLGSAPHSGTGWPIPGVGTGEYARMRCRTRGGRRTLLSDERVARAALLACLHPDAILSATFWISRKPRRSGAQSAQSPTRIGCRPVFKS